MGPRLRGDDNNKSCAPCLSVSPSANLTTGILVILASLFGLPVSTTHVSVGALFGMGLATGQANPRVMLNILFSWIVTLPCAALIGGATYATIRDL